MHETQARDGRCQAAPRRSDVSLIAEQTDASWGTVDTLSVALLAADEQHHDVAVLSVRGEIDLRTAPRLQAALLPVLERETALVVVDLSKVQFMDSTGVHVLADTLRRLEPQNRMLALVCREGAQVHRLLALVGLLDALAVYRSREGAVLRVDNILRSEPGRNSQPSGARALTQSLFLARPTTER